MRWRINSLASYGWFNGAAPPPQSDVDARAMAEFQGEVKRMRMTRNR